MEYVTVFLTNSCFMAGTFFHKVRKVFKWWVILILIFLIVARLMLPYFVLKYVNKTLSEMNGYNGHVTDIDIWLIRGAYVIKDINIWETDNSRKDSIPFFKSESVDLSIQWKSIFKGKVVGEIVMTNPVINFKVKKIDSSSFQGDTADFRQVVRQLMPLTINYFKIVNGQIHYIDTYTSPKVDVMISAVSAVATNLTNVEKKDILLPGKITVTGKVYDGSLTMNVSLDPLKKEPTFDLNAGIKNVSMVNLNNFLRAYANVDVSKGTFGLYTEFAAKDGGFSGYVKPLLQDLDIVQWKKSEGSVPQIAWETIVAGFAQIFTNHSKNQIATKIPYEGTFNNSTIGIFAAVKYVLVNAFIQALNPTIDNTINISNANTSTKEKGFIGTLLSKDKGKDKKK